MIPVLIGVGSNLGNRFYFLRRATAALVQEKILFDIRNSAVYETEPVGFRSQPLFLNLVLFGYTTLSVLSLFQQLQRLEHQIERQHHQHGREREIDLDLLLYGEHQYASAQLRVPHPRMHHRRFVLQPAADVAPAMIHPSFGVSIQELLRRCPDTAMVRRWLSAAAFLTLVS